MTIASTAPEITNYPFEMIAVAHTSYYLALAIACLLTRVISSDHQYYVVNDEPTMDFGHVPSKVFNEGKPITMVNNNFGVIVHPMEHIEIVDKLWKFYIPIDLPCITEYVTPTIIATWRSVIADARTHVSSLTTKEDGNVTSFGYVEGFNKTAVEMLQMINNVEEIAKEVSLEGQYLWGLLDVESCPNNPWIGSTINMGAYNRPRPFKVKSSNQTSSLQGRTSNNMTPIQSPPSSTVPSVPKKKIGSATNGEQGETYDFSSYNDVPSRDAELFHPPDSRGKRNIKTSDGISLNLPNVNTVIVATGVTFKGSDGFVNNQHVISAEQADMAVDAVNQPEPRVLTDEDRIQTSILQSPPAAQFQVSLSAILRHTNSASKCEKVNMIGGSRGRIAICFTTSSGLTSPPEWGKCIQRCMKYDSEITGQSEALREPEAYQFDMSTFNKYDDSHTTIDLSSYNYYSLPANSSDRFKRGSYSYDANIVITGEDIFVSLSQIQTAVACNDTDILNRRVFGMLVPKSVSYVKKNGSLAFEMVFPDIKDIYFHIQGKSNRPEMGRINDISITTDPATRSGLLKTKKVYYESKRVKRGLGMWIMDNVWKPMFGSASEEDVDNLSEYLAVTQSKLGEVAYIQSQLVTVADKQDSQLKTLTMGLKNVADAVKSNDELIKSAMADIVKEGLDGVEEMRASILYNKLTESIFQLNAHLQNCMTQLSQIRSKYRLYKSMIQTQNIDVELFVPQAKKLYDDQLRSELASYRLPRDWPTLFQLRGRYVNLIHQTGTRNMILVVRIPLMKKSYPKHVFKVITYPLSSGPLTVKLPITDELVIIGPNSSYWYGMKYTDYLECRAEEFRVCPGRFPLHVSLEEKCVPSLLSNTINSGLACKMEQVHRSSQESTTVVQVTQNQWVINLRPITNETEVSVSVECEAATTVTDSVVLPIGYQVIEVRHGCTYRLRDVLLVPIKHWMTSLDQSLTFAGNIEMKNGSYTWIKSIKLNPPSLQAIQKRLELNMMDIPTIGVYDGASGDNSTVKEMFDKIAASEGYYSAATRVMNSKIYRFGNHTPSWMGWAFTILIICGIVVIASYVYRRIISYPATLAAVGFSQVPTTQAMIQNVTSVIAGNATNVSSILMPCNSSILGRHTTVIGSQSFISMEIYIGTMLFMLAMHCYVLYSLKSRVINVLSNIKGCVGGPIRSLSTIHHAQECNLIVYLVVKIYRLGRSPVSTNLPFQICTLPPPITQWYLRDTSNVGIGVKSSSRLRLFNDCKCQWSWGNLCLLSRDYPKLDVCKEMPGMSQFSMDDILESVKPNTLGWYKIEISHITCMELEINGIRSELYHYVNSSDHERDAMII